METVKNEEIYVPAPGEEAPYGWAFVEGRPFGRVVIACPRGCGHTEVVSVIGNNPIMQGHHSSGCRRCLIKAGEIDEI